jgi:hypothetical protein
VYRCGLVRQGAEEAVVLARIHANRGATANAAAADDDSSSSNSSGSDGGGAAGSPRGGSGCGPIDAPVGGGADLFDRAEEIATFSAVSAAGLGPQLLALFRNGRLEEFLVE